MPPRPRLNAPGYDPVSYISTSKLLAIPYTDQDTVIARFGSLDNLIAATDDAQPPTGNVNVAILNQIIANATTEINSYLSTIYPVPFSKVGTECILQVTAVDANGGITDFQVVEGGLYQAAPATPQSPVYVRQPNPIVEARLSGGVVPDPFEWQTGSGFAITVAFQDAPQIMVGGKLVTPKTLNGTPIITAPGMLYNQGDLLVLVGGSSFVPDTVINAATALVCYELYRRRLTPDEKNLFYEDAKRFKDLLVEIGHGEKELDGTFRTFYTPAMSWGQDSVLRNANSL